MLEIRLNEMLSTERQHKYDAVDELMRQIDCNLCYRIIISKKKNC